MRFQREAEGGEGDVEDEERQREKDGERKAEGWRGTRK